MIKLMDIDSSGEVPYPEVHNPMLDRLMGVRKIGGVSLMGQFPEITLILNDGPEAPTGLVDYFQSGLLNVVSNKLKKVFESVNAELEYFPVHVIYKDTQSTIDYFVANPLVRLNAIDKEKSDIDFNEDVLVATDVRHLVLNETLLIGKKLAVIGEIQMIAVQNVVAELVEQSGCIGCKFIDPSKYVL